MHTVFTLRTPPWPVGSFRRALGLGLLLLGVLLGAPPARATLVAPLSLNDLARQADRVVLVQVSSARSFWDGKRIYTHTEAKVEEQLKGKGAEPGAALTVRQLGGKVGPKELVVPGTPPLKVGERYVLFLRQDTQGKPYHYVLGFSQGVFHQGIKPDEAFLRQVRALIEAAR